MISKVIPGHSFSGAIRYIMQDKKHAQVLKVEGVRCHDKRLMIEDFVRQHQLRPEKKQACFHSVMSFYPGEKPSDKTIVEIVDKYLAGLNITDTQYAVMKHTDKDHLHVHIIANMVNNQGKSISDNWIGLKGKKQAQKLTKEFKLMQALSKRLELTHYESMRPTQQHLYTIYEAVKENVKYCSSLDQLERRLLKEGITIQYKYKGQTQEKQGISFRLGEYCFKGSEVDRNFSLKNLEKALSIQQTIHTEVAAQRVKSYRLKHTPLKQQRTAHKDFVENLSQGIAHAIAHNIQIMLKPEFAPDHISSELLHEAKRKKKRHRIRR